MSIALAPEAHPSHTLFPAFLKLEGKRVLVVGAGPVAASKIAGLQAVGAEIIVVAPEISDNAAFDAVSIRQRAFEPTDLDDVWYVVAAAPPEINRAVAAAATERRLFVNAVDDPGNASVYLGALLRRDGFTIAISTEGHAPALAGLLREGLEHLLPTDLHRWLQCARTERERWLREHVPMDARRHQLLLAINRLYADADASRAEADASQTERATP